MDNSTGALDQRVCFLARQPPRQSSRDLLLEVISRKGDRWKKGHTKMDDHVKKTHPKAGKPIKGAQLPITKEMKDEAKLLDRYPYSLKVSLMTGEFLRQIRADVQGGKVVIGSGDGNLGPLVIKGRTPEEILKDTQDSRMRERIKEAKKNDQDEIDTQAEAMELNYLLDWDLDNNSKEVIEGGKYDDTLQVIDTVLNVLDNPLYFAKHLLNVSRPHEVDTTLDPIRPVPQHPSLPGGHAAAACTVALVLAHVAAPDDGQCARLFAVDRRIRENRENAGWHTTFDTIEGAALGTALANWMIGRAIAQDVNYKSWSAIYARATWEWI